MANVNVCSACHGINIDTLHQQAGHVLHTSTAELTQCARTCGICYAIYRRWTQNGSQSAMNAVLQFRERHAQDRIEFYVTITRAELEIAVRAFCTSSNNFTATPFQYASVERMDLVWLHTFTLEGDPAASVFPYLKAVPDSTRSEQSFRTARHWIRECILTHTHTPKHQANKSAKTSWLLDNAKPGRLVRIGKHRNSLAIRLVNGRDVDSPYAALSYRWGIGDAPWQTTTANVDARFDDISYDSLPLTLQDAMYAASKVALEYIWVDALCIVQDDRNDWALEAAKMSTIYSQAHITIAADCSPSSTAGLFNAQSRSHISQLQTGWMIQSRLVDGRTSFLYVAEGLLEPVQWRREIEVGNLSNRCWTLQERMLSPRTLHFTNTQLFWECPERLASEDNYDYDAHAGNFLLTRPVYHLSGLNPYLDLRTKPLQFGLYATQPEPTSQALASFVRRRRLIRFWYHNVIALSYSGRQLTHGSDKLVAIGGLARSLNALHPDVYLSGLWLTDAIIGLCWESDRKAGRGAVKAREYRAPSFSWASQETPVNYAFLGSLRDVDQPTHAKVENAKIASENDDAFGLVKGGFIQISSRTLSGQVVRTSNGLYHVLLPGHTSCIMVPDDDDVNRLFEPSFMSNITADMLFHLSRMSWASQVAPLTSNTGGPREARRLYPRSAFNAAGEHSPPTTQTSQRQLKPLYPGVQDYDNVMTNSGTPASVILTLMLENDNYLIFLVLKKVEHFQPDGLEIFQRIGRAESRGTLSTRDFIGRFQAEGPRLVTIV